MARQLKRTTQQVTEATTTVSKPVAGEQVYFTRDEAAAYLRSTPWFIAAAIRQGRLPKVPMGKKFILMRADLDTFAQSLRDVS
jgi:excisionase family DNA binding protein